MTVHKPTEPTPEDGYEILDLIEPSSPETASPPSRADAGDAPGSQRQTDTHPSVVEHVETKPGARGFGLQGNMILLFLVIPLVLMSLSGYFSQRQLNTLATYITEESTAVVRQQAQAHMLELARSVAAQCRLYLQAHPNLTPDAFMSDADFGAVAVQRIAGKALTGLYEQPDAQGVWRIRAHQSPALVGQSLEALMRGQLQDQFDSFWQILTSVGNAKAVSGSFRQTGADGQIRQRFMVCAPVAGTRLFAAAWTEQDDFTRPALHLQRQARELALSTRSINYILLAATLVIVFLVVTLYGRRLAGHIRHLTDVADRIGIGELDAEINIRSRDEIGNLAEALARMQASLRLSIDRLRRRR